MTHVDEPGTVPRANAEPHPKGRTRSPARHGVVAVVVTLPWTVWLVVWLFGLESGFPWVPAIAYTPYIGLTALFPLAVAVVLRRWHTVVLSTVVVAAFAALVVPRAVAVPGTGPDASGPRLVVLTANLYQGRGDPGELADLVERNDVDVLALQEVTPEAVEAMDGRGLTETFPHDVVDARPGVSGSAIFSRHPLTDTTPRDISDTHHFARPGAEITVAGAPPLEVTNTHPVPPTNPESIPQWHREMAALPEADSDGPVRIIAGDFNATLDHANVRSLLSSGYQDAAATTGDGLEITWWSGGAVPGLAIDHVLADDRVAVNATSVHHIPRSDHRAVIAELTLPAA